MEETLPQAPSALPAARSAQISGSVLSDSGALVDGAEVSLIPASGAPPATVHSDQDGRFHFGDLSPGSYTLRITLPGFAASQRTFALAAGQSLTTEPAVLSMSSVQVSVDAVTEEQLGAIELHNEEHQRLVGLLPNFYVSYLWTAPPLTTRQKFRLATRNAADPGNLALVGVVAGVQQATNAFPGYNQGLKGYGRRFGADLGNLVAGTYLGGAVLPSLFHQDPRYFYKGTGSVRSRFWYAISRAVITRGDNGHEQPNFSGVLGDLSAGAVSNLYYPASDRQGGKVFVVNGILAIGGDAMNGLVQEFLLPYLTTRAENRQRAKGKSSPAEP